MTFVQLSYLTWPEAQDIAEAGTAVGLIPVGSLEQHGPHLPLITDTVVAEALARAVAERIAEPVIVAPGYPGGLSDHHLAFPGTVSLSQHLFSGLLGAYLSGMQRMGIRRVGIISGHGGNFRFIGDFAREYPRESAGIKLAAFDDLAGFLEVAMIAGREAGLNPSSTDVHAGVLETSMILHLMGSDNVREFSDVTGLASAEPGFLDTVYGAGIHTLTRTGVLGNPAGATAKAGGIIVAALAELITRWMEATLGVTMASDISRT